MGQAVVDLAAAFSAPLVRLGAQLGLYRALADGGPATPDELAERTGAEPRMLREWLGNQAAGGYVTYDAASGRYTLPPEQAIALADAESPVYLLGAYDILASFFADEDRLVEAFRSGDGMHWTTTTTASSRAPRSSSAPATGSIWSGAGSRPRRRRREAAGRRTRGGPRLRPRRVDDPHGPGLPILVVRGLRLASGRDRAGARGGRGSRRCGTGAVRGGPSRRVLGRGIRPPLSLRRLPRPRRSGGRGAPYPRVARARRDADARRAAGGRPLRGQPQPGRPALLRRLDAHLRAARDRRLGRDARPRSARRPARRRCAPCWSTGGFRSTRRAAETPFNIVLEARP